MSIIVVSDYLIFFALIVISVFWLLESNFSMLINFILIYLLMGVLCIVLGFEFLGLLILLLYSTGVAVVFIITSMAVGTQHIKTTDVREKEEKVDINLSYEKYINNLLFNLAYCVFLGFIFFIFDFSQNFNSNLNNIICIHSVNHLMYYRFLTNLNDVLIIGVMLFQQFFFYTILSGLLLTVALIGSISTLT